MAVHHEATDCPVHSQTGSIPLRDGDTAVNGIDQLTNRIDRRARGHNSSSEAKEKSNRPKQLLCHLCGNDFGTASLGIHIKACQRKRIIDQKKLPEAWRREEPAGPDQNDFPVPTSQKASRTQFDVFNLEAWRIYCSGVSCICKECGCPLDSPEHAEAHAKHCIDHKREARPPWLPRCVPTPRDDDSSDSHDVVENDISPFKSKLQRALSDGVALENTKNSNDTQANDPFADAVWKTIISNKDTSPSDMLRYLQLETSDQKRNEINTDKLSLLLRAEPQSRTDLVDYWFSTHNAILRFTPLGDNNICKEVAEARNQIHQLTKERTAIDQENTNLSQRLSDTSAKLNKAQDWLQLKQNELSDARDDAAAAKEKLKQAKEALIESEQAANAREATLVAASAAAADQNARLEQERKERQSSIEDAFQETKKQLATANVQIESASKELENVRNDNTAKAARLNELQNDLEKSALECLHTSQEKQKVESALASTQAENECLLAESDLQNNKINQLENALASTRAEKDQMAADFESAAVSSAEQASREKAVQDSALAKAQSEVDRLTAELTKAERDYKTSAANVAQQTAYEKSMLDDALAKAQAELESKTNDFEQTAQLAKAQNAREKLELDNALAKSHNDVERLTTELENTKHQLESAAASGQQASREKSDLKDALAMAHTELEKIKTEFENAKVSLEEQASREKSDLKDALAKAHTELEKIKKEFENAKASLEEQASREKSDLEKALAKAHAECENKVHDVEEAKAASVEQAALQRSELEDALAKARAEAERLATELEQKKKDFENAAVSSAEQASREKSDLKSAIANAQAELERMKADFEKSAASLAEQTEGEMSELRKALTAAQADLQNESLKLKCAAGEKADLEDELSKTRLEIERLTTELARTSQEYEHSVAASAEQTSREKAELHDALSNTQAELERKQSAFDEAVALSAEQEKAAALSVEEAESEKLKLKDALLKTRNEVERLASEIDVQKKAHDDSIKLVEQQKDQLIDDFAIREKEFVEAVSRAEREKSEVHSAMKSKEALTQHEIEAKDTKVQELESYAQKLESKLKEVAAIEHRWTQTDFEEDEACGQLRWGSSDPRWRYLRKGEGLGLTAGRRAIVEQAKVAERARAENMNAANEKSQIGLNAIAAPLAYSPVASSAVVREEHEIGPSPPVLLPTNSDDANLKRLERQARRSTASARPTNRPPTTSSSRPSSAVSSSASLKKK